MSEFFKESSAVLRELLPHGGDKAASLGVLGDLLEKVNREIDDAQWLSESREYGLVGKAELVRLNIRKGVIKTIQTALGF